MIISIFVNMNINPLEIVSVLLCGSAVASAFVPRFPAFVLAYAALLCDYFAGVPFVTSRLLLFWGLASLLLLGIDFLRPSHTPGRAPHIYIGVGSLLGVMLGIVYTPATAAMIFGGAVGAFLGAFAYNRTPKGPKLAVTSHIFLQILSAKGLPAVITFTMAAISVLALL